MSQHNSQVVRNRTRYSHGRERSICHSCFPFNQDDDIGDSTSGYGVRWMGNEEGEMPLPSWAGLDNVFQQQPFNGDPYGQVFQPPSCDVVLREHYWFWQPDTESSIKSTHALVRNYLTSVGRASNLILNIAPDVTGAVPTIDVERYNDFGSAIKCLFANPIAQMGPLHFRESLSAEFVFAENATNSTNISVILREDLTQGQLIDKFTLECCVTNASEHTPCSTWIACPMGSIPGVISAVPTPGIGHKRIYLVAPEKGVTTGGMRVNITSRFNSSNTSAVPALLSVQLFDWSGKPCV